MSIAQVAKLIGRVAKSPMGKLGMAAVAGVTVASIFSGCKKEVLDPPPVYIENPVNIDADTTQLHPIDSLIQHLDSIVHP